MRVLDAADYQYAESSHLLPVGLDGTTAISAVQYHTITADKRRAPAGNLPASTSTGGWEAEVVVVIVEGPEGNRTKIRSLPDSSRCSSTQHHLRRKWEEYVRLVEEYPLIVKTISASALFLLADATAQGIELLQDNSAIYHSYDILRSLRFASFGLFGAPWSHFYFSYLDACLPPTDNPWTRTTLLKLFIDQFVQAPILLAIMVSALTLMEGHGVARVEQDLTSDFMPTLIANCEFRHLCWNNCCPHPVPAHSNSKGSSGYQRRRSIWRSSSLR